MACGEAVSLMIVWELMERDGLEVHGRGAWVGGRHVEEVRGRIECAQVEERRKGKGEDVMERGTWEGCHCEFHHHAEYHVVVVVVFEKVTLAERDAGLQNEDGAHHDAGLGLMVDDHASAC